MHKDNPVAFHPKATNNYIYGRSSDSFATDNRLPIAKNLHNSGIRVKSVHKHTATGIVLDLHQIPFSSFCENEPYMMQI